MNNLFSQTSSPLEDISIAHDDREDLHAAGANPLNLDELVHELRQPLSTIESLAYYLEMISSDDQACRHLQRIRAMIFKAHEILEQATAS